MFINIRKYEDSDLLSLAQIYKASIIHLGSQFYSEDQVFAWSGFADDLKAFEQWISNAATIVALNGDQERLGFGGIEGSGRISSLFVSPSAMRKGVGTSLLKQLISSIAIRGNLDATTVASEFSKTLFEKFGFTVSRIEVTSFRGITFKRYAMKL